MAERSRRPHACPTQTPKEIVEALIEARRRHPSWGAKNLLALLSRRHSEGAWPARSTVCDILDRHGLVRTPRARRRVGPGTPTTAMGVPNGVWCADFKGQFKTRDGVYCYPLTVTDGYSRYLLGCQALSSVAEAKPVFVRLFRAFGLPECIRTDSGVPFATTALARLSSHSAWWVRLGILPEFIEPGKPQQNGRHERMHKTLEAETTRPGRQSHRPAKALQHLPRGIQPRTPPRSARDEYPRLPLSALAKAHALKAAPTRLPRPLRGALRELQPAGSAGKTIGSMSASCAPGNTWGSRRSIT
ncbi:MAG: DDE-type integrase/transposase/recombinase, partial [Gammaproteobacteria bacterium]